MKSTAIAARALLLLATLVALASCSDRNPRAMIATANPLASQAGLDILRQGGSAADAAIAAQLVLGLVEPQSSGIGGGLFALHWSEADAGLTAIDGRETAPTAAGPGLFLKPDGTPMEWTDASIGGRPVGVPGTIAALWELHRAHGRLDWKDLFEPAIALAERGFAVSPRLAAAIAGARDELIKDDGARLAYFRTAPDGSLREPLPAGASLVNRAYADTLRRIAEQGTDGFYRGPVADSIRAAVAGHAGNPGLMTPSDLAGYRARTRDAVCAWYRAHQVCGMPPPTSGGLTSLMILKLLEPYRIGGLDPDGAMAAHLFAQASRLAFADRDLYMADADFADVPAEGLLDETYLRTRARLIDPARDMGKARPGSPPRLEDHRKAAGLDGIEHGTSHLAVVDGDGNAVSMTMSVEQSFGAHITAAGFVLNNQLTDFSFVPEKDGRPVANRPQAGKRPRSSMSPTIVFGPDGDLFALTGSPGGSRIIGYTVRSLMGLIDWRMTMQQAVELPHVINRNGPTELEAGTPVAGLEAALGALGHEVEVRAETSGLHGIRIVDGIPDGGADKRREGKVMSLQ